MKTIAIPKRGKKSATRLAEERRPAFRRAQRWRAGGEGTISRLKRKYGLRRSRYREYEAVSTGIGLGIFAHNVRRWAQRHIS
jgi:IS5 family transposase